MEKNLGQVVLVKDIRPGTNYSGDPGSSFPSSLTEVNGLLYFGAYDRENGGELWVSDGTTDGTQLVADINPDNSYGNGISSNLRRLAEINGLLYFTADDGESGQELWVSDGTTQGTKLVADINSDNSYGYVMSSDPRNLTEVNGLLYFSADDGESGYELWVSDGTGEGTRLVKDIKPNNSDSDFRNSSFPKRLTEFNGLLYFAADDGENGRGLWVSDGTTQGTQLVANISPDTNLPSKNLTEFNGLLYFAAYNQESGQELWVSDGTTDGTQLVADIRPNSSDFGSSPENLTEVNGLLYFAANDGENGVELWVSDGTTQGTRLVADIRPDSRDFGYGINSSPRNLTEFNGLLYFTADDGKNGHELWVSDGTTEGTQLVKDIKPNIRDFGLGNGSYPQHLTEFNGLLYFAADDGKNGQELWVSDGTTEGTQLVTDLNTLVDNDGISNSSRPDELTVIGEELYFRANDGENGIELFKLTFSNFDTINPTNSADNLVGTGDADEIDGLNGKDTINGGGGNDTLFGSSGSDELFGETGDDLLEGGNGGDVLNGGGGNDTLKGDRGDDNLFGSIGDDSLDGGMGDDLLNGGAGHDTLTGGGGNDMFVLRPNRGKDVITDFEIKRDRISLSGGLAYENLTFSGNAILLDEEVLATLDGVNTENLSEDVFQQFELE